MKKTFFKNLFRDIKNTPSRFISIVIIIAVGVAFYSGVRATSPSMKASADYYLDKNNFMDFQLISTLGITKEDMKDIQRQKGIDKVEGSYSLDGVIERDDKQLVLNVNSLPDENGINDIRIIKGRRPKASNEVVIEDSFMNEGKYKINDVIELKSGNEENLEDDLEQTKFKIVGTANSPIYLSQQRQISSVGNGNVRGFMYVLPEIFKSEVYTEVYARTESDQSKDSILNNKKYKNYTNGIETRLKNVGTTINENRYEEVLGEASDKIEEAEEKLKSSKAEADKEFSDARKKIDEALVELEKGNAELEENEKKFNKGIADGEKEIEDGKKAIEDGQKQITTGKEEIENGKAQIKIEKDKLKKGEEQLNKESSKIESSKEELNKADKQLESARQQIKDGEQQIQSKRQEIENGKSQIATEKNKIKQGEEKLNTEPSKIIENKKKLDQAEQQLNQSRKQIEAAEPQINSKRQEIQNGKSEIEQAKQKLNESESQINNAKQKAANQIASSIAAEVKRAEELVNSDPTNEEYVTQYNGIKALYENSIKGKDFDSIYSSLSSNGQLSAVSKYVDINKIKADFDQSSKQVEDGKSQLSSEENKLQQGEAQLNKEASKIEESKKQINQGQATIDNGRKEIEAGEKEISRIRKELESGKSQIASEENKLKEGEARLNKEASKIEQAKKEIKPGEDQLAKGKKELELGEIEINKARKEIENGKVQIANEENKLIQAETDINKAAVEIEESKKKISEAEISLEKGRQEGLKKLEEARKKLDDGQEEIYDNFEKLTLEEDKAYKEIEEAEIKIEKNKEKLKDIKEPDWYVLGRSQNLGYETYRQDSDRIDNIGKVFPLIFFLVAALVSLTTMTRMVQEKRTEIGTFKALGYSPFAIISHYLIYSLASSIIGSIIGVLIGFKLFPPLIIQAYSSLYSVPDVVTPFITSLAIQASLIAILFTSLAAVFAVLDELREVPASLMRPKPPKAGKKILLERVGFIWKRLKFTSKVTARNIFRYKQRLLMTVIGIAACTGLMITGFGLRDGIIGATEAQFDKIYKYDMEGTLNRDKEESDKETIKEKAIKDENLKSILFVNSKSGTVKAKGARDEDAFVIVPEYKSELNNYIKLYMKDKTLNLKDDGVIITEKLSQLVDKKIGDTIDITIDEKVVTAKITDVTQQYIQHYIYMSPVYYKKITEETMTYNNFYGLLKNVTEDSQNKTANDLKTIGGINSVSFKSNSKVDYDKSVESINSVVFILIASAGVLAFVVIYNLTNINITERRRELATIKLLGFYNKELAAYIYRENIILTLVGSFVGIFVGIFLNKFVLSTAETNVIKFLEKISPIYFVYSVLLTILFSVIVNLAMYKRFDKIDMIESLKSSE